MDILRLSAEQTAQKVRDGSLRAIDVTEAYLERIGLTEPRINAYLNIMSDTARAQARGVDAKVKSGTPLGRLAGVPFAIKDNILIEDHLATCGSNILKNYRAPYSASAVQRLIDEDAIILGKTNMDEFAMGSSTERSAFKVTSNPWDISRVPGGSSGGSAAAIAASSALLALGSDTGGSIRQPAAFCGVTGLKPTYGSVSRYGLVAFASSLDQIGPLGRDSADVRLAFDVLSSHDPKDATSIPAALTRDKRFSRKTIGLPKEYFDAPGLDIPTRSALQEAIRVYQRCGWKIKDVSLPNTKYALCAYYVIAPSEASANLARFDGIRYGRRAEGNFDLAALYRSNRTQGFGEEVQRRIIIGTFALSHGYYDAYY
ncbi:MAG: amidase family protein, partial [Elusimicrobiota bacterium]